MMSLYRVPEPDPPGQNAALDPGVSQQLWKTTLHNFTPDPLPSDYLSQYFELVVLNHRPRPSVSLPNFVHPENAVYLIGPDSRDMRKEDGDIPQQMWNMRRHHVHIPTGSLHPMFGHVVWALVYWDRKMKALR